MIKDLRKIREGNELTVSGEILLDTSKDYFEQLKEEIKYACTPCTFTRTVRTENDKIWYNFVFTKALIKKDGTFILDLEDVEEPELYMEEGDF